MCVFREGGLGGTGVVALPFFSPSVMKVLFALGSVKFHAETSFTKYLMHAGKKGAWVGGGRGYAIFFWFFVVKLARFSEFG